MIAYLQGKVIAKNNNSLILENGGIGYRVFVGENLLAEARAGEPATFFIHQQIKEDADDLYGFKSLADLELFEMLLSVSGVGPKSALAVLSLASAEEVKATIIRGDAGLLTKVSGIGQKTAARVVLELKNKAVRLGGADLPAGSNLTGSDEIDALIALGYSLGEAREALMAVEPAITSTNGRIKAALKKLSH
jgi:Holliday junction DNA helicase RuvA